MTNPVRLSPPGGMIPSKDGGVTLLLGEAVVEIDWITPPDDELAGLLLALLGETALAEALAENVKGESI